MKTILIALDFSEHAGEVEKVGYDLARKLGTSVTLITVINKALDYTAAFTGLTFPNQWEERLYLANQKLDEVKERHPDVETRILSFIGNPKEDIVEVVFEPEVAFVVLGKYGRTGWDQLVMGGTSSYVVQHSVKPVIVVPFKKERH
ncbi:universal stress protein [Paraflavisolibacter sp. H34]|uniref:universal stress protein n=1 Tax=Huijunlia imazamoxiresistens TaxID=3127457 RepID=UPI00301A471C